MKSISRAPGTQTNNDTADEVPIDLCGGTEHAFKTGTVKVPPPIPPAFENALAKNILNKPIISFNLNGNNDICLHVFF